MKLLLSALILSLLLACAPNVERVDAVSGVAGKNGTNGTNGHDGAPGASCTASTTEGGVIVQCGTSAPVLIPNGAPGVNGLDAISPGLSVAVHNLPSWDGSTSLPQLFVGNPIVGIFTLPNLSVPDSQSSLGFPGMPVSIQSVVGTEGYALDCSGYINVQTSGDYVFKLLSDDGSELRINDVLVINNQGLHAPSSVTSAPTRLNRGLNRINVVYYQGPATQIALELKWSGPNLPEQVVPAAAFTH